MSNKKKDTFAKLRYKEDRERFIEKLVENNFNIMKTCKDTNIPKSTVYWYMKNDEKFHNEVKSKKDFMKAIVANTIMNGLMDDDKQVRLQFLDKLSRSDLLAKLLDEKKDDQSINLDINKNDIELG